MISHQTPIQQGPFARTALIDAFLSGPMAKVFGSLCVIPILLLPLESNSVHGRVQDEQGHPISKATVRLHPAGGASDLNTSCKADGEFRIDRLPAGTYTLYWQAPHYYEKIQVEGSFPAGRELRPEVTFPSVSDAAVTLVMKPTSRLIGQVYLPNGRPLRNGSVPFIAPRPEMFSADFHMSTNREGAFEVEFPYDGEEAFEALLPHIGYIPITWFHLAERKTSEQDFHIQPAASLVGQVRSKTDGRPARKAYILVNIEDPGVEHNGTRYARYFRLGHTAIETDDQGNFSVENLPAGDYTMKVYPSSKEYFCNAGSATPFKIKVTDGERRTGIALSL